MSCASLFSNRPPPPTCSRSSAARLSTSKRCSKRWWSRPRASARADMVSINRPIGDTYHREASYGFTAELNEHMAGVVPQPGPGTVVGRALMGRKIVHILDAAADPDYTLVEARRIAGFRTMLGVPLLREGVPVGVIMLARRTVRPFTNKQIELVTTFADQAVIAIENVRLFDEIQDKSRQLELASENKSQFLSSMSHELR